MYKLNLKEYTKDVFAMFHSLRWSTKQVQTTVSTCHGIEELTSKHNGVGWSHSDQWLKGHTCVLQSTTSLSEENRAYMRRS